MTGALDGTFVLDFTAMMAGPYCTRLLADLGADVVKVEPPEGDHIRKRPPLRDGQSAYFGNLNCGKRSMCVDLRKEAGRELVRALAARADVIVENFRPGVMGRLGLGYESVRGTNPGIVYCSISGFGQRGRFAARPAYAPVVHAASGYDLANLSYQDGLTRPLKTGLFIADVLAGALAFGAVNAALARRAATGDGEHIDLALMDAMFGLMVYECMEAQFPVERRRPLYRAVRARDGFVIVAPVSANNFDAMARAVGHPEWAADPRFATAEAREHHWGLLMDLLDEWAGARSAAECEAVMTAGGVPCSRYHTVGEAMRSEYAEERHAFVTVADRAGSFRVPNTPFKLAKGRAGARDWVAALGEHSAAVAAERLGLRQAELDRLFEEGVLFTEEEKKCA
ncbi:MAG: CoA transferase [Burkholderiales bacterium]|nr:CoA transferase [Burkholderiales bacterium]